MCGWKWLVDRSDVILKNATKIFGQTIVNAALKVETEILRKKITQKLSLNKQATFFGHFCAGEDERSIKPNVERLLNSGVGAILDYAAEGYYFKF